MVVRFSVDGGTKGLSLDKEKGLLFVANGDKGVLVYYLNMILDKLTTK
jgi:myo-inositol-hexaphosphate 3-phosphohydrolase